MSENSLKAYRTIAENHAGCPQVLLTPDPVICKLISLLAGLKFPRPALSGAESENNLLSVEPYKTPCPIL